MCQKFQQKLEHCLQAVFYKWGMVVGRKPWLVMPLSFIFVLFALGFLMQDPFDDVQVSWAPISSEAAQDDKRIQQMGFEKLERADIIYKAKNDENVLTRAHFQRVIDFNDFLLDYNNKNLRETDCRATNTGRCIYAGSPIQYFQDTNGVVTLPAYTSDQQLVDKLNTGRNDVLNSDLQVGQIFGGTTPADIVKDPSTQLYNLQEAKALKLGYIIYDNQTLSDYVYEAFDEFLARPGNDGITLEIWSFTIFERTLDEGLSSDRIIVNISIVLLITYSLFVLGTCHPVGCRASAAGIGVGSTMMAYAASFGICSLMGLKISNMHPLLPFLLLGIGADDMYVITAVVDQVNPRMVYKRRIAKALKLGGVSILITSFTDAVAFMLSGLSSLPSLRSFAIFAGLGVLFDFFFQISFFASFLSIDLWRQEKNRKEFFGLLFCKPKSWFFCCGKCTPADECQDANTEFKKVHQTSIQLQINRGVSLANPQVEDTQLKQQDQNNKTTNNLASNIDPNLDDDKLYNRNSFMQTFLRKHFSRFVTNGKVQIFILLFFAGLTAFAGWGVTKVQTNFSIEYFVKSDQRLQKFYDQRNSLYPKVGFGGSFWTDSSVDLMTEENQQRYLNVLRILDGTNPCSHCGRNYVTPGSVDSWYFSFINFIDSNGCNSVCTSPANCKTGDIAKYIYVKQCLKLFFDAPSGGLGFVGSQVLITTSGNEVTSIDSARSSFATVKPTGSEEAVRIMDDLRQIASESGLTSSFMYSRIFLTWEQYKGFNIELLISIASALAAIFVIVFIFSGNVWTSLLVLSMMGLVDLNLVTLIWYWGLELNFITMVNLILAIGLAVDYSAHIAHAYNFSDADPSCKTNRERRVSKVRGAFAKIGTSVFHGAFSTFLAIVTISASTSYVFRAFFKQWFGIIVFGMLHAFFLLPVLLSLIGPLKRSDKVQNKTNKVQV